jgi:hypothetical protein
MYPVTAFIAP